MKKKRFDITKETAIISIDFDKEDDLMQMQFNLFGYEQKAIKEKLKSLTKNDVEYWDAKLRLVMVNACLEDSSFTPPYDINAVTDAQKGRLKAYDYVLKNSNDDLLKARVKYDKMLSLQQIKLGVLQVSLQGIEDLALKYQTEIKRRIADKLNAIGITDKERAELKKGMFEITEFINSLNQIVLDSKGKLNKFKKIKSIEQDILKQMVKTLHKEKPSSIDAINTNINIYKQEAEIEQIQYSIDAVNTRLGHKKIRKVSITIEEADKRLINEYNELKKYLTLLEQKERFYQNFEPNNDIELFEKMNNLYYLGIEIEAKKEFLYFYLKRKEIVK